MVVSAQDETVVDPVRVLHMILLFCQRTGLLPTVRRFNLHGPADAKFRGGALFFSRL